MRRDLNIENQPNTNRRATILQESQQIPSPDLSPHYPMKKNDPSCIYIYVEIYMYRYIYEYIYIYIYIRTPIPQQIYRIPNIDPVM